MTLTTRYLLVAPSNFRLGIGGTWAAHLLPFIEEQNVYSLIDFKKSLSDPSIVRR